MSFPSDHDCALKLSPLCVLFLIFVNNRHTADSAGGDHSNRTWPGHPRHFTMGAGCSHSTAWPGHPIHSAKVAGGNHSTTWPGHPEHSAKTAGGNHSTLWPGHPRHSAEKSWWELVEAIVNNLTNWSTGTAAVLLTFCKTVFNTCARHVHCNI